MGRAISLVSEKTRQIWVLPCKSQEIDQGPLVHATRNSLRIDIDRENAQAEYEWMKIRFEGVYAYEFTSSDSCTPEQIAAYDKVVEVLDSAWRKTLLSRRPGEDALVRHYRLYLDDIGCYDVIADSFVAPDDD
jgi:hypothetical protein